VAKHREAIRVSDGFANSEDIKGSIIIDGDHEMVSDKGKQTES
jgi:hypothetical protein